MAMTSVCQEPSTLALDSDPEQMFGQVSVASNRRAEFAELRDRGGGACARRIPVAAWAEILDFQDSARCAGPAPYARDPKP